MDFVLSFSCALVYKKYQEVLWKRNLSMECYLLRGAQPQNVVFLKQTNKQTDKNFHVQFNIWKVVSCTSYFAPKLSVPLSTFPA